jgi:hypothetical protein
MPEPLWLYLRALLYFPNITTCSAMAAALDNISNDGLTRMPQGTWSGHICLALVLRALFTVAGEYLIVADTVEDNCAAHTAGRLLSMFLLTHSIFCNRLSCFHLKLSLPAITRVMASSG